MIEAVLILGTSTALSIVFWVWLVARVMNGIGRGGDDD